MPAQQPVPDTRADVHERPLPLDSGSSHGVSVARVHMQVCMALQTPASPGHWEFIRHWTHVFVVVSHWRKNLVPAHWVAVRHSTQRIVDVLQTPPAGPAAVHWDVIVQVRTHEYVLVLQAMPVPQLASPRHATHRPAGEQYGGSCPPH
jgi:hypothetical protein